VPEQNFTLTDHTRRRMRERGISEEAVGFVLTNYHTSRPAPRRQGALPSVIYVGDYQGRNLKVYVIRDSSPPVVTTVVFEGD
jgi:hypothetical protein